MSKKIGQHAELRARQFLESRGLTYITSNYHSKQGEIDLIMREHSILVFIEVRLRTNPHYGHSIETVSKKKQRRIIKAALHFLQKNKLLQQTLCRFDVVGLRSLHDIVWIKNAFIGDLF